MPTRQAGVEHTSINTCPEGVLVRDFIRESLYSEVGYFNASRVINSPGVINFNQLLGRANYEKRLQELYYAGVQGWTTPVEIFQPVYAQALARWMLSHVVPSINLNSVIEDSKATKGKAPDTPAASAVVVDSPENGRVRRFGQPLSTRSSAPGALQVVEIGAGNGTCAVNIMDFVRTFFPGVYPQLQYRIAEMSEQLSWQQRELLDSSHPGHYHVNTVNAAEWRTPVEGHAFVFGLEVLDNMPHDKVVRGRNGEWFQVMVAREGSVPAEAVTADAVDPRLLNTGKSAAGFVEYAVPVSDPVVQQCTALYTEYLAAHGGAPVGTTDVSGPNDCMPRNAGNWLWNKVVQLAFWRRDRKVSRDVMYLPTESLRFLHRLDEHFPQHTLLLADFDLLPSTEKLQAVNGPVIAHKAETAAQRGQTQDADSYMVPLGQCDIFFPTDFAFLKHMYQRVVLKDAPARDGLHHFGLQQGGDDMRVTPLENTATVCRHADFLWKYAETSKTECRNGFNPMLEDYTNMVIFVGSRM